MERSKKRKKIGHFPPKIKDGKLKFENDYSGVNLVFYALLRTKHFDGAIQLLEKGCIGIRPILIGTKILNELEMEWGATPGFQNEMKQMAGMLSQYALSIINYIQEKDERNRHKTSEGKRYKTVNTTGKLLLNHGYLEVAYRTENECFLDNAKLKTMLQEMWYGEGFHNKTTLGSIGDTFLRLFLCLAHIFILPVMFFTLGKPAGLYKKYHLPILKLWINMFGLVSFLAAFAYMLLFDYAEDGMSRSECAVLYWIGNKCLDEIHQILIIPYRRTKRKSKHERLCEYLKDIWNGLDWFIVIFFFVGFVAKYLSESDFVHGFAKIMFLLSYILLNMRILNMFWTYEFLGTRLVIILKMFEITVAFMAIMVVIMMCYNVVDYALLYPNTDFTLTEVQNIAKNGFWAMFGDFPEDVDPDCTNNKTVYQQELKARCPTSLGEALSPYLRAIYGFVAIVMLLNLLIAIYTKAIEGVDSKSRIHWSKLQSKFLEEYTIRTIFPVHFKVLCLLACAFHAIIYLIEVCCGRGTKKQQLFMKVLFFDKTYDNLQSETTDEEIDGMLEMQRETTTSIPEDNSSMQESTIEKEITNIKVSGQFQNEKIQSILTELNSLKSFCAPKEKGISLKRSNSYN